MADDEILLEVEGLSTRLGGTVKAVDGVDLTIRRGETFALLGESGCGKSMTALSLMRLLPSGGRIIAGAARLGETPLLKLSEQQMREVRGGRIGMIFQEPMTSLNPVLTIGDQIAEAVRRHDPRPGKGVRERVLELLKLVHIPAPEQRIDEYPHQLSGGMKQRVMIAGALAGRPDLLIADEPTTALDVTIQAQVLRLLKELQHETGMAILLITHDLGVVAETADRVAVMYAGEIVETGPVAPFFGQPLHPYSRKLFQSLPNKEKRGNRLDVIEGMVPPLDQPHPRCRFSPRCPLAEGRCDRETPQLAAHDEQRAVRCHFPDKPLPHIDAVPKGASGATASAIQPLLATHDLQVHFPIRKGILKRTVGHVRAVDGIDLRIPTGRTLGLVGESGCGKTTVGKGILQLIRPTGGRVMFDDTDLTALTGNDLRRRRGEIQIIFQDPFSSMNPRMTIGDIVAEGMVAQGMEKNRLACEQRVKVLLEKVGIRGDTIHRYPHEFSGGQRQRICIARALAVEPKLIICDEPTSALDVSVQAQILNLLADLQQEMGLSYLFITHNISAVSYIAHEVAVMYLGRIVESGATDRILENPRHPYTRALLASVPQADPAARHTIPALPGDLPSPASPPDGCHFHPRCPDAGDDCRRRYPDSRELADGRMVKCYRVED